MATKAGAKPRGRPKAKPKPAREKPSPGKVVLAVDVQRGDTIENTPLLRVHPRQEEFLNSIFTHRFTLYGGARGGGKSRGLRWALVYFLFWCSSKGFNKVRVGLFCITYSELWDRQITKIQTEFPEWLGSYNGEHEEFRFYPEFGGHVIQFCNMQNLASYQSAEFAAIAVDEITLVAEREALSLLMGSLRWTDPVTNEPLDWCPFFAGTNPNGPGHAWVKRLWVTKDFTNPEDRRLNPEQFNFVRCLPSDNPFLPKAYQEEILESMPEYLRKPWLEGSWDIVAGQRFPKFRRHVHLVEPFDLQERFGNVLYYRCIDYGTYDPMAIGWYGVVRDGGRLRAFKVKEHIESGLNSRDQARRVAELTPKDMPVAATYLDTQAWGEYEHGLSMADIFMQELGTIVLQVLKSRPSGWDAMDRLLAWECGEHEDGTPDPYVAKVEPALQFFNTCQVTANQIEAVMWDPKKGNDILDTRAGGAHQDALHETRYFCLTHLQPPQEEGQQDGFAYDRAVWKNIAGTDKRKRRARRLQRRTA